MFNLKVDFLSDGVFSFSPARSVRAPQLPLYRDHQNLKEKGLTTKEKKREKKKSSYSLLKAEKRTLKENSKTKKRKKKRESPKKKKEATQCLDFFGKANKENFRNFSASTLTLI